MKGNPGSALKRLNTSSFCENVDRATTGIVRRPGLPIPCVPCSHRDPDIVIADAPELLPTVQRVTESIRCRPAGRASRLAGALQLARYSLRFAGSTSCLSCETGWHMPVPFPVFVHNPGQVFLGHALVGTQALVAIPGLFCVTHACHQLTMRASCVQSAT